MGLHVQGLGGGDLPYAAPPHVPGPGPAVFQPLSVLYYVKLDLQSHTAAALVLIGLREVKSATMGGCDRAPRHALCARCGGGVRVVVEGWYTPTRPPSLGRPTNKIVVVRVSFGCRLEMTYVRYMVSGDGW